MSPSFSDQPDLNPKEAARLSGVSYWTILREIERGKLRAYRRPGKKLAIRRDDFSEWAYAAPVSPKEREAPALTVVRPAARPIERGSVAALDDIERRRGTDVSAQAQ